MSESGDSRTSWLSTSAAPVLVSCNSNKTLGDKTHEDKTDSASPLPEGGNTAHSKPGLVLVAWKRPSLELVRYPNRYHGAFATV